MKQQNNSAVEKISAILGILSTMQRKIIKNHLERPYKSTFQNIMLSYLSQMTKIERQKFVNILRPSKAIYVSSPFDTKNSNLQKTGQKSIFNLEESIDFQQQFQLTVKTNIQNQITNIFSFGLEKCTYSTDNLCLYIKEQLNDLQMNVFSVLLENIQKPKQDMLDNFVNYALNRPSQSSLQININDKILNNFQKSEIINKVPLVKFIQVVGLISKKLMDLTIRCFSVVNQLLKVLRPLEVDQPQKQEIISAYLIQLVIISIGFSNTSLGSFINLREIKQSQVQLSDKLIGYCEEWQDFFDQVETKYHAVWRKLTFSLSDQVLTKSIKPLAKKESRSSFSQLEDFVKLNYKSSIVEDYLDESKNQDISEELISKLQLKVKLLNEILHAKNEKLNFNFYSLTKIIINKNISKVIESEAWVPITIMSSKIQNSVGFLLYGQTYINSLRSQDDSRTFLSKSLLLEKSNFGFKRKSEETISPSEDYMTIQTSEKHIKIGQRNFKLMGVTEYILQVIYLLFLYFDKYSIQNDLDRQSKNEKQKQNIPEKSISPPKISMKLLLEKTLEIVHVLVSKFKYFVNNLKQLQKKVKSFAKFLLLTWVQLDFFKTIIINITDERSTRFHSKFREQKTQKQVQEMRKSFLKDIDECMNEITKKYNSIGYEKIKQSIKKIEFNPKNQIKNPSQITTQVLNYFSKSLDIIKDSIIDNKQFWRFLNCPWTKIYLQKINDQYSQIRKMIMKSNGSNSGKRLEEIEWQDKLNWKAKELKWILTTIDNQGYSQHLKDLHIIEDDLKKLNEKN